MFVSTLNTNEVHHIETQAETVSQEAAKETVHWVPRLGLSLLVFLSFWIASALVVRTFQRVKSHTRRSRQVVLHLLMQVSKFTLIVFGIATALGTLGVNISPIVAGLGLTGFAVGFALKDIISNVISGSLILFFQPFQIKDYIAVTNFEGTVINIELRYTVLLKDEKYILIPNANIFSNPVVITPAPPSEVENPTRFEV
jgi:small conductance mechanosensitive channel